MIDVVHHDDDDDDMWSCDVFVICVYIYRGNVKYTTII